MVFDDLVNLGATDWHRHPLDLTNHDDVGQESVLIDELNGDHGARSGFFLEGRLHRTRDERFDFGDDVRVRHRLQRR